MEKKHREKSHNTGKTQGKHREFYLGWNVATLFHVQIPTNGLKRPDKCNNDIGFTGA